MTDPVAAGRDAELLSALKPLSAIDPSERVAAPPQRLPLADGRECLVLWRPDSAGGDWSLVLHGRTPDIADTSQAVARLAVHMPSEGAPAVFWEDADDAFRDWIASQFATIVQSLAQRQPSELASVRQRAGLSNSLARKLGEMLPHMVALGGLVAFAYMFGIVHIK
jgi:hypothetical protein